MRAVLIAMVTLLAVPVLAQVPGQNVGGGEVQPAAQLRPPNGNPGTPGFPNTAGTPVVVDRDTLMQQLASINEKLATATGRAKKDKQLLKLLETARADLKEVGRQVSNAPLGAHGAPASPAAPASAAAGGAAHHRGHAALAGGGHPQRALRG